MTELTTPQAAQRLGVTVGRVCQLIWAGVLSARKLGRDWLVDSASIAQYQANRKPPGRRRKETTMLEVTVVSEQLNQTSVVKLNGYDRLTPRAAVAARNIAHGLGAHVTMSDGEAIYRVTRSGARKIED